MDRLDQRLQEAYDELWNQLVDPHERYYDVDGRWWNGLDDDGRDGGVQGAVFRSEAELAEARRECRQLAATNEFAINGHENRISYAVGTGHRYRVLSKSGKGFAARDGAFVEEVQAFLDEFLAFNRWSGRQREAMLRSDRDGEVFLRLFVGRDDVPQVRFVEPGQVSTPSELATDPTATFGIRSFEGDVETVRSYYVDGEEVDAEWIQHRKANVDSNVKRGVPLFYAVRKNLRRAEKLLRNMSTVSEIQSAIALIRKHRSASRSGVQQYVDDQADARVTNPQTGRSTTLERYGPGTILDSYGGLEYDFPAAGLDAGNFVTVLQAELRAIAARLVMPEFMLTSDASNANYASTMVAEGPAVKMFERLQGEMILDDVELLRRVVRLGEQSGRVPTGAGDLVEIQATAPSVAVRDRQQEADVARIEYGAGILSPQTWSLRSGLNYEQEQRNLADHKGGASTAEVAEIER